MNSSPYHKFTLFSYPKSSASWRVRIALDYYQFPYEIIDVNLLKNEQNAPEFIKINPNASVPVLKVEDKSPHRKVTTYISQSTAILECLHTMSYFDGFLHDPNDFGPLFPRYYDEIAKVRSICNIIACDIHPLQNLRVLKQMEELDCKEMTKGKWAVKWITRGLDVLEKTLKETSGKYCFGNAVTMADIYLIPQCFNAKRFKCFESEKYPILHKIYDNCLALDCFRKTAPTL